MTFDRPVNFESGHLVASSLISIAWPSSKILQNVHFLVFDHRTRSFWNIREFPISKFSGATIQQLDQDQDDGGSSDGSGGQSSSSSSNNGGGGLFSGLGRKRKRTGSSSSLLGFGGGTRKRLKNPLKGLARNPLKNVRNPLKHARNPLKNLRNPLKGLARNPLKNARNPLKNMRNPLKGVASGTRNRLRGAGTRLASAASNLGQRAAPTLNRAKNGLLSNAKCALKGYGMLYDNNNMIICMYANLMFGRHFMGSPNDRTLR